MDGDLLRPGWPWFRFQKILTELRNHYNGFGLSTDCLGDFCDVVYCHEKITC